jgi:type II secretory pathway component PulM
MTLKDSIFSEDSRQQLVRQEMNFEFEKKEAVAQAEHKKELESQAAIADEKARKQKMVLGMVAFGLVLVLAFSMIIFRSLRITRRQKLEIELQKNETQRQKELVEVKQKEILDSIHYARRIQHSLLPTETYISRRLEKIK